MKMPFGKFKDTDIEDLPSSYLKWAAGNLDDDELATACDKEWQWREDNDCHWYGD